MHAGGGLASLRIEQAAEGQMKRQRHRHWLVRRQIQPKADGQRRWDRAYQLLLAWAIPLTDATKEAENERGDLRARVESATGAGRDH